MSQSKSQVQFRRNVQYQSDNEDFSISNQQNNTQPRGFRPQKQNFNRKSQQQNLRNSSYIKKQSTPAHKDSQYQCVQIVTEATTLLQLGGRAQEAFAKYDLALQEGQKQFGDQSQEFRLFYQDICQQQFNAGMKSSSVQDYDKALEVLFSAEKFTKQFLSLDPNKNILALNNIGCVYRRMQRFQKAIQFLEQAAQQIQNTGNKESSGITSLNQCAVYSQMGEHQKAFQYASQGLLECQNQLLEVKNDPVLSKNQHLVQEKVRYVSIAYYNMGVEEEHSNNLQEADNWYQKSIDLLQQFNGVHDNLLQKFKQSQVKCKKKIHIKNEEQGIVSSTPGKRVRNLNKSETQAKFRPSSATMGPQFNKTQQFSSKQQSITGSPQQQEKTSFYFQGNQMMSKTTKASEGRGSLLRQALAERRTIKYSQNKQKHPQLQRQNFFSEQEDNDYQENQQQQVKYVKRPMKSAIVSQPQTTRQKHGFMSSVEKSRDQSDREMSDLEKMGVLRWSDSEEDDGEDEQMKAKRMNFLQSLNNYNEQPQKQDQKPFQPYKPPTIYSQSQLQQQQNQIPQSQLEQFQQWQRQQEQQKFMQSQNLQQSHLTTVSQIQQSNVVKEDEGKQKQEEQKKQLQRQHTKSKPGEFAHNSYDIEKIMVIQRMFRKKMANKRGKKIREEQLRKKEEYLQEKERIRMEQLNEEERQKELERKEEELRLKREKEEEEQRKLLEQKAIEEQKAIRIQREFRKKKQEDELKQQLRLKRKQMLYKKQQIALLKAAVKLQRNYKMIKAKKELEYKLIQSANQLKKQALKKYTKGLKEIQKDIFLEWENAPISYYNINVSINNKDKPILEQSLVYTAIKCRGHEEDKKDGEDFDGISNQNTKYVAEFPLYIQIKKMNPTKLRELKSYDLNLEKKNDLLYFVSQLDQVMYKKQDQILFEELTDVKLSEFNSSSSQKGNKKHSVFHINLEDKLANQSARKIQKAYKGNLARHRISCWKYQRFTIIKIFNVQAQKDLMTDEFIQIVLYREIATGLLMVRAKNFSTNRQFVNTLEYKNAIQEKYPKFTRQALEDLFYINPADHLLEYTELAKDLIGLKEEEEKEKVQQEFDSKYIIKAQAQVRMIIAKSQLRFKKLLQDKKNKNARRYLVTKRQYVFEYQVYNFCLYYNSHPQNLVEVTCTMVGKNPENEQIPKYYQEMFSDFSKQDLYFYGPKLLERATLKKTRKEGEKKIIVPRIEEIMADIRISVKKALGQDVDFKESTVEARKIFNQKRLRMVQKEHKSVVEMLNINGQQERSMFKTKQGMEYAKLIQIKYRRQQEKMQHNIQRTKNIKGGEDQELEELKQFALAIQTTSNFVVQVEKLEKREAKRRRIEEEGEIVKPEQHGIKIQEDFEYGAVKRPEKPPRQLDQADLNFIAEQQEKYDKDPTSLDQVEIDYLNSRNEYYKQLEQQDLEESERLRQQLEKESWLFDIYYQKEQSAITVIGLRQYGDEEKKDINIININLIALHYKDAKNYKTLANNIRPIVLDQLRFVEQELDPTTGKVIKQNNLYYEEPFQETEEEKNKDQNKEELTGKALLAKELAADASTTVHLQTFELKDFILQYSLSVRTNVLCCFVTYKQDTRIKTEVLFMLSQFDCAHMENIVGYKNSEELEYFFKEILQEITKSFVFRIAKQDNKTHIIINSEFVTAKLPTILQDVFAVRLQKTIKAFRLRRTFQTVRDLLKTDEFFLQSFQKQSGSHFLQISFFLERQNFELKIIVGKHPLRVTRHSAKYYKIKILKLKEQFDLSSRQKIAENLAKKKAQNIPLTESDLYSRLAKEDEDPIYLTQNKWLEIQGAHDTRYYRGIYKNLLNYLFENIDFQLNFDKINAEPIDQRIHLIDIPTPDKQQKIFNRLRKTKTTNNLATQNLINNINAILCLQRACKRIAANDFIKINKHVIEQKARQVRQIGERCKRAFKQIRDERYIVNIFQKENLYTFHLINVERSKKREGKSKKDSNIIMLKGQYEYDPNKLLNTKDKTIPEYLLDQLDLSEKEYDKDGNVVSQGEIYFKEANYTGIDDEKIDYIPQKEEEPQRENQVLQKQGTFQNLNIQVDTMGEGVPETIQSNLVDYVVEKDEDGRDLLYNVVYTGKKPKERKDLEKEEDATGQTVKIDVDLGELKKLYPTVDAKSQGLMKIIGEQLIEGIKINEQGQIILDSSKINPHCINVAERQIDAQHINEGLDLKNKKTKLQQSKLMQQQDSKTDVKKILLKNTRFFSKIKYLILIYLVERKVNKIVKATQDSVFQEYETIYQVYSLNLSTKNQEPLIWEITPEEVNGILEGTSNVKTVLEKAKYVMRRVQIFNNQYIFVVDKKENLAKIKPQPNLVLFFEKGLQPIQIHFRNRVYRKNFKIYKDEMRTKKSDAVWIGIPQEMKSLKTYYLLVCFQKAKSKRWEFVAWDMLNYDRYTLEVEKQSFQKYTVQDLKETIAVMSRFFDVDFIKQELYFNDGAARDYAEKYFKERAHRIQTIKTKKKNFISGDSTPNKGGNYQDDDEMN